jgi:DNA-binding beta-propeller fold protein YncE
VDVRRFDDLSRRVGALALPRLPRRSLLGVLGSATLAGTLGLVVEPEPAEAAKCKKEGQKCDKKKCKKKNKNCCCKKLKCKNDRCEGKGPTCPTDVEFDREWGGAGSGPGEFDDPWGIATDPENNVYVTDTDNFRVQVFNQNGNFIDDWGVQGNDNEEFQTPLGIGFNRDGNDRDRVYVADPDQSTSSRKFRMFQPDGDHVDNLAPSSLDEPVGIGVDANQRVWVADSTMPGQVFLFNRNGGFVTSWTPGGNGELSDPEGIAVFEDDDTTFVYVADTGNDRVVKFEYVSNDEDGLEFVEAAGSTGTGNDEFNGPTGMAIDECGNLWVADRFNNRIQQLDKDLNFEGRFSDGFVEPTGVAIGRNGASLYVVSSINDLVKKFDLV